MFIRVLTLALVLIGPATAGGRGGHNTTFDPNQWPGYTIKNFITDYSATCNGVADDSTALAAWNTAGVAQNPGKILLYIPPGSKCRFVTNNAIVWNPSDTNPAIQNAVIWAYGASVDITYIGGGGFYTNDLNHALINTASAGATTVTVNDGNVSRFTVGDYVLIGGLSLQNFGYPPNLQYFEFRSITAINGNVISFNGALTNTYLSTWPAVGTTPAAGPATVYKLLPSWVQNTRIFGLTITSDGQVGVIGRNILLTDVVDHGGLAPSVNEYVQLSYTYAGNPEIDKQVIYAVANRSWARVWTVQSPVTVLRYENSSSIISMNGQGTNHYVFGGSYAGSIAGIGTSYGAVNLLYVDGAIIPTSQKGVQTIDKSTVTYGSSTMTIALADSAAVYKIIAPGHKYYLGSVQGEICLPQTSFTVLSITANASNVTVTTDMPSLPGSPPLCNGTTPWSHYNSYSAMTVTQINKPAGSADLTIYAAP